MFTRRDLIIGGTAAALIARVPSLMALEPRSMTAIEFMGRDYFIRAVKNDDTTFYFSPGDQPNIDKPIDLITIIAYRDVKNYDQLCAKKDQILKTFDHPAARILGQDDVPPSPGFSGGAYFEAGASKDGFTDAIIARFTLAGGVGYGLIYTHSFYDTTAAGDSVDAFAKWLTTQGMSTTKSFLGLNIALSPVLLEEWKKSAPQRSK
jgi:hypothetical protein